MLITVIDRKTGPALIAALLCSTGYCGLSKWRQRAVGIKRLLDEERVIGCLWWVR